MDDGMVNLEIWRRMLRIEYMNRVFRYRLKIRVRKCMGGRMDWGEGLRRIGIVRGCEVKRLICIRYIGRWVFDRKRKVRDR